MKYYFINNFQHPFLHIPSTFTAVNLPASHESTLAVPDWSSIWLASQQIHHATSWQNILLLTSHCMTLAAAAAFAQAEVTYCLCIMKYYSGMFQMWTALGPLGGAMTEVGLINVASLVVCSQLWYSSKGCARNRKNIPWGQLVQASGVKQQYSVVTKIASFLNVSDVRVPPIVHWSYACIGTTIILFVNTWSLELQNEVHLTMLGILLLVTIYLVSAHFCLFCDNTRIIPILSN